MANVPDNKEIARLLREYAAFVRGFATGMRREGQHEAAGHLGASVEWMRVLADQLDPPPSRVGEGR